jgi:hypothetical protein
MQQVRVEVYQHLAKEFEYLFDSGKINWAPVFDEDNRLEALNSDADTLRSLKRKPSEAGAWFPVRALKPAEASINPSYEVALRESAPSSGSFILMSPRRRGFKAR